MSTLIKNRQVVQDTWRVLQSADEFAATSPAEHVVVPLALWREQCTALLARPGRAGVWLGPADDPAALFAGCPLPELIAVHFPSFTDGRGFSTGRLLRERHGFRGELRAIGDVIRDILFDLARCGFDAFALRSDQKVEDALKALDDFSEAYQAAADRGPLFARRFAAAGSTA
jgi:uncharacterized protein (DUF934 family)